MKTVFNNQKKQWNQLVIQNNGSFLQSWQWGEFQKSLGRRIWRIVIEGLKGLVIKHTLPLGKSYLYCPRGPVIENPKPKSQIPNKTQNPNHKFQTFLEEIEKIARQERAIFLKIEPSLLDSKFQIPNSKFVRSLKEIQPSKTLILDITKPEEELLNQMHPKTRYNIRLAQRKGVRIRPSLGSGTRESQVFLDLLEKTAQRDKFRPHPREYYQKMLEVLGREGMIKLFLAQRQNQIIAANLVCFFGQTATYLHGASDYNFRQLMAPHLLQWQAILEAKELGLKYYDFWGIDEKKWPGLTRFKKGFGGQEVVYPIPVPLI
jgi:lipid II:glycine glycyltransferase (peptidoglycan interpeptide bridge formation enzyme)